MTFETHRLFLRPPIITDAQDILKNYATDEEVTRFLTWVPHKNIDDTEQWINYCISQNNSQEQLRFVILHRDSEEVVGMVDFRIEGHSCEFGYVLAKNYWGQGIMTEAMSPVVQWIFQRPEIYRLYAFHALGNPASGRVMEKLGLQPEGILRRYHVLPNLSDKPVDVKVYSKVK
jgi:ribosomal-protein-alanine N-acetyltransferase